ncbi:hypothetical protein [Streptomyces sp. A1499]|uniref:hypothetical protein n=1 Tax=Streptomyces sp. A1499 TaxID=2563104 RepID=UPI00109E9254|nr:hypothetical protein [Streptomyces sp. A1499]THC47411.1 hypothetical protein E7X58_28335 [Streptomyces sp. A1499]
MTKTCRSAAGPADPSPWRMNLACQLAIDLRDDAVLHEVSDREVASARSQGALSTLSQALRYQAISRIVKRSLAEATELLTEARTLDEAARAMHVVGVDLLLVAFRGDVHHYRELRSTLGVDGRPNETVCEQFARAVLRNGLGNYEAALQAALLSQSRHQAGSYLVWTLYAELVEAAVRAGRPEEAAHAADVLKQLAKAHPVPWAMAQWLQARALLDRSEDCDVLYREAIATAPGLASTSTTPASGSRTANGWKIRAVPRRRAPNCRPRTRCALRHATYR